MNQECQSTGLLQDLPSSRLKAHQPAGRDLPRFLPGSNPPSFPLAGTVTEDRSSSFFLSLQPFGFWEAGFTACRIASDFMPILFRVAPPIRKTKIPIWLLKMEYLGQSVNFDGLSGLVSGTPKTDFSTRIIHLCACNRKIILWVDETFR